MPIHPGDKLAGYEVTQLLGRGGMGEVFEAWQPSLQRHDHMEAHAPLPRNDVVRTMCNTSGAFPTV